MRSRLTCWVVALAVAAAFGIAAPRALASDFNGDVSGLFSNWVADGSSPHVVQSNPNSSYHSRIEWGAGGDPSSLQFDPTTFSGDFEAEFLIGGLDFRNGAITSGTGISSVDLTVNMAFIQPALGTQHFTWTLNTVNTPNSGTPEQQADYLVLPSLFSTETISYGGNTYYLEITRFTADRYSFTDPHYPNRFYVYEDATGHAGIYGKLTVERPPAVPCV